jgi:hypothetical protein
LFGILEMLYIMANFKREEKMDMEFKFIYKKKIIGVFGKAHF